MALPALSQYIGTPLEPTARLIADAVATAKDQDRAGLPQLAGLLAADLGNKTAVLAIMPVLEAAWLAGYRVGLVDGMIESACGQAAEPDVPPFLRSRVHGGRA